MKSISKDLLGIFFTSSLRDNSKRHNAEMSSNKYICILVVLGSNSMAYLSINKVKRPFLFICLMCYCLRVQLNSTYSKHKLTKCTYLIICGWSSFPLNPEWGRLKIILSNRLILRSVCSFIVFALTPCSHRPHFFQFCQIGFCSAVLLLQGVCTKSFENKWKFNK